MNSFQDWEGWEGRGNASPNLAHCGATCPEFFSCNARNSNSSSALTGVDVPVACCCAAAAGAPNAAGDGGGFTGTGGGWGVALGSRNVRRNPGGGVMAAVEGLPGGVMFDVPAATE